VRRYRREVSQYKVVRFLNSRRDTSIHRNETVITKAGGLAMIIYHGIDLGSGVLDVYHGS
jgi:hypothetical protein